MYMSFIMILYHKKNTLDLYRCALLQSKNEEQHNKANVSVRSHATTTGFRQVYRKDRRNSVIAISANQFPGVQVLRTLVFRGSKCGEVSPPT